MGTPESEFSLEYGGRSFRVIRPFPSFKDLAAQGRPATGEEQLQATKRQIENFIEDWSETGVPKELILTRLKNWSQLLQEMSSEEER